MSKLKNMPRQLGRKPLEPSQRKVYIRHPLSLRQDQWDNLFALAKALNITSRSGPNHGKYSWRTMIALLAEQAPVIIEALKKHQSVSFQASTTPRPILIVDIDGEHV